MPTAGAQAQLAVKGAQDIYLIAPNELTFWKSTYPRHTNFAITEIEMPFNNTPDWGRQKFTCKVSRSGDLVHSMYCRITLPAITYAFPYNANDFDAGHNYTTYVDSIGHALLQEIQVNVGAHEFDTHYSEFLESFEALSAPSDRLLTEMTGHYGHPDVCALASLREQNLYVPMRFWFNRFTEQALPLVALYWHDVELVFSTRQRTQLFNYYENGLQVATPVIGAGGHVANSLTDMHILANLVYLDRPERAAFANSKSEYVIDQTQFLGCEAFSTATNVFSHSIRYNHPVCEIIFMLRSTAAEAANDWFNFWGPAIPIDATTTPYPFERSEPFHSATVLLNNQDRTVDHPAVYYRTVQPWQSHSRIPAPDRCVYCYSFGLRPEEMIHTGSVNMSRLDNAFLRITYNAGTMLNQRFAGNLYIFARSKNVAKVTVGMMGIKFAA